MIYKIWAGLLAVIAFLLALLKFKSKENESLKHDLAVKDELDEIRLKQEQFINDEILTEKKEIKKNVENLKKSNKSRADKYRSL